MSIDHQSQITTLSARAIVSRMFEELTTDLDEFSLPKLTDEVFDRAKADEALWAKLLDESVRPLIYEIGLSVLSSQRARRSQSAAIRDIITSLPEPAQSVGPPVRPQARAQPRSEPRRSVTRAGFDWLRHPVAVAPRETIRLRRAVRDDLKRAIRFGAEGIEARRVTMAYYEFIEEGLTSDTQAVAERYTEADLAALWARAERRIATEDRVVGEVKQKIAAQRQAAISAPQPTP
jgi:hypothetical protein